MGGGAYKKTTDGRWAHILCALMVPGAQYINKDNQDVIDVSKTILVPQKVISLLMMILMIMMILLI